MIGFVRVDSERIISDLHDPSFSSFLNMVRWMAAAIVFFGHLRNPLFFGYGELSAAERNLPVMGWYFITGWFAEAVIVFFVLSGFLIGGIGLSKRAMGRFIVSDYAIDRFSRLYVPYVPALLLTLVLDYFGSRYLGAAGLYDGSQAMISEKIAHLAPFEQNLNPEQFFGSISMLQTFYFVPFGSNSPLWTISCEFWFYFVFGLAMVVFPGPGVFWRRRIIAGSLLISIFLFLGVSLPYFLGLWLIGMIVALLPPVNPVWRWLAFLLFLGLLFTFRFFSNFFDNYENFTAVRNYSVAISFAVLLHTMRGVHSKWLVWFADINKRVADFSFSLYLIHFPLMLFLLSALYGTGMFPEIRTGYSPVSATGIMLYLGIIIAVLGCAWLFSQFTEMRTPAIRLFLRSKFPKCGSQFENSNHLP